MTEQTTVGQRFMQLISHLGISKNAFANSLDKTATVIQHLVEERNKPGFDLLCKVFDIYPNISKDWLIQGAGPMFVSELTPAPATSAPAIPVVASHEAADTSQAAVAPVTTESVLSSVEPVAAVAAAVAGAAVQLAPAPAIEFPIEAPAAAVAAPAAASVLTAPVVVAAPAPEAAWQTALYTQQMAHQLAMAELRNQHLQDQQRLMQQMLDLMQRKL